GPNGSVSNGGQVTFLEAIKQAMFEEMERDPAVILMGEDVGVYGGAFKTSEGLLERFGWERVIDTPISESAIIGAACGMSYSDCARSAKCSSSTSSSARSIRLRILWPRDTTCGMRLRPW